MSSRLKEMSQSAALVTGPLGGIASRLSILSTVVSAGPLVMGLVATSAAIAGMTMVITKGVAVTDKRIVQLGQLSAQLQLTGNAAGTTTTELDAFARMLALNTLTSTEEVRTTLGMLITTTDLTGDVLKRTTAAAQDMAQVGFGSITANAKTLAKALSDPEKALTRLEKFNIKFTQSEEDKVKVLLETNKTYEAQEMILNKIERTFGELGKVNSGTMAAQTDEMSQRWDELTESIEGALASQPGLVAFMKVINQGLTNIARDINPEFFEKLENSASVAKGISLAFGDAKKVIGDKSENGLGDMLDSNISLVEKLTKKSEDLANKLENIPGDVTVNLDNAGTGKPTTSTNAGVYSPENEALLKKQQEFNATHLMRAKETVNQLMALQQSVTTHKQLTTDRQVEIDKVANDKAVEGAEASAKKQLKIDEKFSNLRHKQWLADNKAFEDKQEKRIVMHEKANELMAKAGGSDSLALYNLTTQHDAEMLLLGEAMKDELNNKQMLNASKLLLDEQYAKDKLAIMNRAKIEEIEVNRASYEAQYDMIQTGLGAISDIYEKSGEDHKRAQKNIFLVEQALAFAMNIVNTQAAMSKASAMDPTGILSSKELAMGIARGASIAATTVAGVAHGGLDSVPSESTFLLQKGERVIQPKANQDLTSFLKNGGSGGSGGSVTIQAPLTIQGNVTDQKWFQQELYKHRQLISSVSKKAQREKPRR